MKCPERVFLASKYLDRLPLGVNQNILLYGWALPIIGELATSIIRITRISLCHIRNIVPIIGELATSIIRLCPWGKDFDYQTG